MLHVVSRKASNSGGTLVDIIDEKLS